MTMTAKELAEAMVKDIPIKPTLTRDEVEEVFWEWRKESDYKNLALYEFRNIASAILRKAQEK